MDKGGPPVGDLLARARERERVRLDDRLSQFDKIAFHAVEVTHHRKSRAGYSWNVEADRAGLLMAASADNVNDETLTAAVDALCAIEVTDNGPGKKRELDIAYRAVTIRLGELRRETLDREG